MQRSSTAARTGRAVTLASAWIACLGLAAVAAETPQPDSLAERAGRIMTDLRRAWVSKVAVVAPPQALADGLREALQAQADKEGVTLLFREVDTGSPDRVASTVAALGEADVQAVLPLGDTDATEAILRAMRDAAVAKPALLYEIADDGSKRLVKRDVMPVFDAVMEQKRPTLADQVVLVNDATFSGQVTNPSVRLRTGYADELELKAWHVAGIAFDQTGYRQTVFTVNANRLSGYLLDPAIRLEMAGGRTLAIRNEKMKRVVFHTREGELRGIPRHSLIVLTNGDVVSGRVLNETLSVQSGEGKTSLSTGDLERLTMVPGRHGVTTIKRRDDDELLQGILLDEDFRIRLDLGQTVSVYRDRVKAIAFERGYSGRIDLAAMQAAGAGSLLGQGEAETAVRVKGLQDAREMIRKMQAVEPIVGGTAGGAQILNSVQMLFVYVQPGTFEMGSDEGEPDEQPVHTVRITRPFYMSVREVTQAQWHEIMVVNPSDHKGTDLPVTNVSWDECRTFCRRLTEREHASGKLPAALSYRLPTEAEWEYACRAGSAAAYCFGDAEARLGEYAWYKANSDGRPQPVGRRQPNAWGLFDMHGNVWEWCQDLYDKAYYESSPTNDPPGAAEATARVVRGGAWKYDAATCRSANRGKSYGSYRSALLGFRVVLVSSEGDPRMVEVR